MIEPVTRTRFINWFRQSDTYKDNFSFFAHASLYDYFEEFKKDYNHEEITDLETLRNFTTVIEIPNRDYLDKTIKDGFIIRNF